MRTVAREGEGIEELWSAVERFRAHQAETGAGERRRRRVLREKIREATERALRRRIWTARGQRELDEAVTAAVEEKRNPYELAAGLAQRLSAQGG